MTGATTAWDRAALVERTARAIFGGLDEVWDRNPAEQVHYRRAAERALAVLPGLLEELAEKIEAEQRVTVGMLGDGDHQRRSWVVAAYGDALRFVRGFAAEVQR